MSMQQQMDDEYRRWLDDEEAQREYQEWLDKTYCPVDFDQEDNEMPSREAASWHGGTMLLHRAIMLARHYGMKMSDIEKRTYRVILETERSIRLRYAKYRPATPLAMLAAKERQIRQNARKASRALQKQ